MSTCADRMSVKTQVFGCRACGALMVCVKGQDGNWRCSKCLALIT